MAARLLLFLTWLMGSALCDRGVPAPRPFTPLWFSVEPVDVVAARGAAAVLNCSVESEEPPSPPRVDWRKDGTLLNLGSDERRRLLQDGSLLITAVVHGKHNKPDEGVYQCVTTIDGLGSIVSRSGRVTVAGVPRFTIPPEPAVVYEGDNVVLSCDVTSELSPFTRWEHSRQPVQLGQRVLMLPDAALLVSNATQADTGLYRCVVEHKGVAKASEEAELRVIPESEFDRKPVFLRQPMSVTHSLGDDVVLPCVVSGFPTARVRWLRRDKPLQLGDERFQMVGGGSLHVLSLLEEDGGTYLCQVDNGNETLEAEAQLTVRAPPHFLLKPSNIYAHESEDIVFRCEVTGSPQPTVQWLKNGDAVIPSDYFRIINRHDLQILGLVRSDEGFYQCLADNEAGNVQASAQLIILEHAPVGPAPSAPRDVVASLVSTRFVKLTWRPPAELHGDDVTFSVYYRPEDGGRERLETTSRPGELQVVVQNLTPDTRYTFRVVAHNKNGAGESSAPVVVATQPEVQVPGPAPNLQATPTSPTSVTVTWETPPTGNGDILAYKLYYMEQGVEGEQDVDVTDVSYTLGGLKKFTQYSFRVVAYNKHGPGVSTEDVSARTYSDVPSAPPHNLTLDVINSKSIMVRWQPPPPATHNGEIVGYRLRYRKGTRKSDVVESTGGTQLYQLIDGLERGSEYTFRVSALTVNGSGPSTEWVTAETFTSDLDESHVPDVPTSLHVRPLVSSIVVSWSPPENQDVVVRGYTIGYGIGSPHTHTVKVDHKQRFYTIENLDPSSQYVITLKAFNNVGEGIPVYESAVTRSPSVVDPSPMLPPVGVQASVLAHDSIRVSWADNSLPKNQKVTDSRYYTIRWKTNIPANTRFKTANSSSLSYVVTGLKPHTLYEFSVMVTRGRRSSTWSMTAHGTTLESVPGSAPKDVTVVSKEGRPRTIIINWQPPSEANGKISGYVIYYSTDAGAAAHDWVVEPVVGNRLTHQLQDLTLDTRYYFKLQARNTKGMGPLSEAVQFHTPKVESPDKMANDQASGIPVKPGVRGPSSPDLGSAFGKPGMSGGSDSHVLLIVIIATVGVFTVVLVMVAALICTRRSSSQQKKRAASKLSSSSHKHKGSTRELKPPDLWIHHERLEMKPMDKSPEPNPIMTETPIPRPLQDPPPIDAVPEKPATHTRGVEVEESAAVLLGRRGTRAKGTMPPDTAPVQQLVRPVAPGDPLTPAERPESEASYQSSAPDEDPGYRPPAGRPMKSFAVPAVLEGLTASQLTGKTASIGSLTRPRAPVAVTVPSAPGVCESSVMLEETQSRYETDELSEEMAHLEGLMKDLNAITTA